MYLWNWWVRSHLHGDACALILLWRLLQYHLQTWHKDWLETKLIIPISAYHLILKVSYHTHHQILQDCCWIQRTISLIPEIKTLLKAYLRWKINHMLISNISLNNVCCDFGSGFKIQECPGLNIALLGVWEFTLWSESKVIKKWIGASLAPLSCQISVVPTRENTAPSLRNKCLSLGAMLCLIVIKAHWGVFCNPSFVNPDPNVNPLLGWS